MLKYLCVLTGAIVLSGCATDFEANMRKAYGEPVSEPKNGERARIRAWNAGFPTYVDQNVCGDRPDLPFGIFIKGPPIVPKYIPYMNRSIGMPQGTVDLSPGAWGEMYIRADQQVAVIADSSPILWRPCRTTLYFKPEPNRDYEFRMESCNLQTFDITGGNIKPIQLSTEKLPCN